MKNQILNKDSRQALKALGDNSIDLIITDPPYHEFSMGEKWNLQSEFLRICRGTVIVFSPPEDQWVQPADQYLFWIKPISTKNTSKRYSRFVEMIFVYREGTWNTSRHWSQYTNVFTDLVDQSNIHPFRKPPSLIRRLILNHSNPGDLILDPFMGSGTTIIEARNSGRFYIGIEKDESYCQHVRKELLHGYG